GSTFAMPFTKASVPDVAIGAVRFNGTGYDAVPWLYTARLDPGSRTMTVSATPDKSRYQPGDTATVSLRTLDPAGHPVAASVFVRAIDEKLYAMGAASDTDPVQMLYTEVPSGLIAMTWSHKVPAIQGGGGGGDTTGGGGGDGRTDFRDWLVAKVVHTDADGRATVQVPLSDDLTSWRVAATAVDAGLDAGATSVKLPVGLPFFVDAVLAPEYLSSDRPVLRVRSFGSALLPGTRVTFAVSSDTLPMPETTVAVDAFGSAYLPLPALSVGTHRVRIAGTAIADGKPVSDVMVRTFTVVANRATQLRTTWSPLVGATQVESGAGLTSVVLVDAGRGRVVPFLERLAWPGAVRSDQELAAALANRVLHAQFGLPAVAEPDPNGLDVYTVSGGLSIVSWGSPQLDVTALAAMADDPRLAPATLTQLLSDVAASADETRARRLLALAGLAALGEPVGSQIRDAAVRDITVEEQVHLALAALEAGDEALAGEVEQQVLARAGMRSGDQVRIDPGPGADATVVTARLAIVAASLGDPVAAEMDAYLEAHPSKTTLVELERALAARGWATRVAAAPATAALTIGGSRREVTLKAGQAVAEVLTLAQATTATVEPVSGSVLVVQTWDDALKPTSLAAPKGVTVERTVRPSGTVPADGPVVVTYAVTIPDTARGTCWRLVDNVPSGLAPIPWYGAMAETSALPGDVSPTLVDGQRVEFCVGWAPDRSQYTLRYVARVVTPGTYTWEPEVLQSTTDPASGLTGPATTIEIATPRS
ncbi:MAG: alpha-2-macroglobulin family protein, partial [Candidatus Limnocylindrales bacterium]